MSHIEYVNKTLSQPRNKQYTAIDLFAGCGGLALGFAVNGFLTTGYEIDIDCCTTYKTNLQHACNNISIGTDTVFLSAEVVIGGPPCQPFSVGGLQKGIHDSRNGFPAFIAAIEQLNPDIWLFENVRGLLYKNKWYLDLVTEQLRELGYIIEMKLVNAVDYGVPQNRERLIVIGHRGEFNFPEKLHRRIPAGEALGSLAVDAPEHSKFLTASMDRYVANYEKASKCVNPRDLALDRPARTLTCRNLAGATGDMQRIRLPDGRRRRLTIREAARLQTFPDWFEFSGKESSIYKQIGNAVPPMLSYHLARSVLEYLKSNVRYTPQEIKRLNKAWQPELNFA